MKNLTKQDLYSSIIEQIQQIDVDGLIDVIGENRPVIEIVEKQKVYFWIRLYLKSELSDIAIGDDFSVVYKSSGESLPAKFIAFGKKNLNKNVDNEIINYIPEDDFKVLCLMVDEDLIKENSENIPFIRTLFKTSTYYEFQVYRRDDLNFINKRTSEVVEYIDVDF